MRKEQEAAFWLTIKAFKEIGLFTARDDYW